MRAREHLIAIKESVTRLHPAKLDREVTRIVAAGVRARDYAAPVISIGESEPPPPTSDGIDRWALNGQRAYRRRIAHAAKLLQEAANIEAVICERLGHREASELLEADGAQACENCTRMVERTAADPILSGRCRACYEYRRRHDGHERPRELWEAA